MQIKFEDVSYLYKNLSGKATVAVDAVTLDLSAFGMTAIVGHTGSGKSTAMQHINGLLQPTTGTMHVNNLTISAKKNRELYTIRKEIGYVFQNPNYQLFSSTVLEDVMYGPINFGASVEEAKIMAKNALELVGLPETLYDKYPFDLSGGQMRKVAIAGSLAYNPQVLILDEPTVGLDPLATEQMITLFAKLHKEQNKTLIFITHDMEFVAKIATRVVVFEQGKVVVDSSPHALFSDVETTQKYALTPPMLYQIYHDIHAKDKSFQLVEADFHSIETFTAKIKQWQLNRREE